MANEIAKKEETKPAPTDRINNLKKIYSNPDYFDNESNLLKEFDSLSKKETLSDEEKKKKAESTEKMGLMYGLENGVWAANLDYHKNYASLARMRQRVIRDYNCKTSLELMLADSIVSSYWRIMKNERAINRMIEKEDSSYSFDQLKVNVLKELNREVDLANRRLNTDIVLLKEMKQPALKVNVKTNNAFIGQNQQFNDQTQKDENNEPK